MLTEFYVMIYTNDGTYITQFTALPDGVYNVFTVTDYGIEGQSYHAQGNENFIGYATSPNATTPDYPIGSTITVTDDIALYVVEKAAEPAVTIEYNNAVIASLKAGQSASLPCKDKPMLTDVVVTVPEGMKGEVVEEWDGSIEVV